MKKILSFVLMFVLGVLVVPNIVNADVREVDGFTYSRVDIDYSIEEDDYIYVFGILSPSKYIVYNADDVDFHYFENGLYREADPTPEEVIKSREIMWYEGDEYDYYYDYDDETNRDNIIKSNSPFYDFSSHTCYEFSTDLTEQEGISYYEGVNNNEEFTLVLNFDESNAHNYYKQVDCDADEVVYTLTEEESTILENLIASIFQENEETYADKFNLHMRYFPIKVGESFVNVFQTVYTNEDVDPEEVDVEFEYIYQFYDLDCNELGSLDDYTYMIYMEKSNFIVAHDNSNMYILDSNFNVVFEYEDFDFDYYLFDIDADRLLIDYEDGDAELITRYVVLEGQDQTYNGDDLSVRISGELSLLDEVYIDDTLLSTDNYTTSEGSTIITLKNEYLSTLRNGTYTLRATFTDGGVARATFIVDGISNPSTGDNVFNVLLITVISLISIMCLLLAINKKKFN